MTNGWVDIKNTDMMLIMGGNPAENHPCGFKWPVEAKRNRNAKMIVVDPRFTRTASVADLFCQIRAGSDIAFLGGVIHYAIENNRIAKDYLAQLHECRLRREARLQDARRHRRCFLRLRRAKANLRPRVLELLRHRRRAAAKPRYVHGTELHSRPVATVAGEGRFRPHPAKSQLRLSAVEEALFPLHPRDGRAHHRHSQGSIHQGRRPVHFDPQRRRHQESRHHHLRRRLDPAQLRHADHPHRGDAPTVDGERWTRRRRRQCAARPFQHSGRHRHGRHLR